jgi:hypothetical protein
MRSGLATEFRSEKIPRNRLRTVFIIRRNPAPANRNESVFLSAKGFGSEFREFASIFVFTERNLELFSLQWNSFGTEFQVFASIFVPRYRIPSIFLLCRMVRNGSPRVFCSAEQPEFHRNKPIVPSFPSSAEQFFCRKFQPYMRFHTRTPCFSLDSASAILGAITPLHPISWRIAVPHYFTAFVFLSWSFHSSAFQLLHHKKHVDHVLSI